MRISIIGLGYVGSVSAACLAREGNEVVGVDKDDVKVRLLNEGCSPIVEPCLGDLIADAAQNGMLRAVSNTEFAISNSCVSLVCVGTPSRANGSLNLDYVREACEQIGMALRDKPEFHVVVLRSTMLPGTVRSMCIPVLEAASGKRAGVDFGVCVNPEFLREGTAIHDYDNPPKTVIGSMDTRSAELLKILYSRLEAPLIVTTIEVAEAVKYTDNAWHAVKVNFANEIGAICDAAGVDGDAVMDVFLQDRKLNISPAYMRPGPAFGGSCLPKDVRALTYFARSMDVEAPMLSSVLPSNDCQLQRALHRIEERGRRNIGVLGVSFKADTDDLRESPMLKIVQTLYGRGYDIRIFDPNVSRAAVSGANRAYILNSIPHVYKMLTDDPGKLLEHAGTIVIGTQAELYKNVVQRARPDQTVVDLAKLLAKDEPRPTRTPMPVHVPRSHRRVARAAAASAGR